MASSDRWAEWKAGTLPDNVVVQHHVMYEGTASEQHQFWVFLGGKVYGPITRASDDAQTIQEVLAAAAASVITPDTYSITCEDGTVITGEL